MHKQLLAVAIAICSGGVFAEENVGSNVEEMLISGVRERLYNNGMLKDVIQKTEVISEISIERVNAVNLTEALAEAPGVRVNNECSMCGVKRLMLNGLRGEHTTILVDGIPSHTMMSAFYGIDAATTAGIQRIEIARGTGASMTAPEAIGGTINLITKVAEENGAEIDISGGETGYKKASVVGTTVNNNDTTRITLIGQYDSKAIYDGDNNGVGENPDLENKSGTVFISQDFGSKDNLRLRFNLAQSEIFGGPSHTNIDAVKQEFFSDPDWESDTLFVDNDVRNHYIGRSWETTEWIQSDRSEFYINWLHEVSGDLNISLTTSINTHKQDSFYEGFIYKADNTMRYADARINWSATPDHLLTLGIDTRQEELRSDTNSDSEYYISDSFDYDTYGFYIEDAWSISYQLEISAALRFDHIKADFIDPQKPGVEIDESILSPRIDARWTHNNLWTSRLSVGRGYRAPLSFFESDHGILDGDLGFDIQIKQLEHSLALNYALSYEGNRLSATGSLAHSSIENLATLGENDDGVPVLAQADDKARALVADIALSYSLTAATNISATIENIHYNNYFKQAFGVVPAEERLILSMDWNKNNWDFYIQGTWIGSRNLNEYGTPESPSFDTAGIYPKSQTADAYWTIDFRLEKEFFDQLHIYAGANNLLNYTQVNNMETPLFYENDAFDVAHIYGPLRGRMAYLGLKYHF